MRRALAALLLLASCRDAEPQPDTATGSTPAAVEVVARELTPAPPPSIELLDAGAEPRTPLVLRPVVGTQTPLDVALALRMKVRAGGTEMPAPLGMPRVIVHGRVIVDSVGAEEIRVRHLADSIEISGTADAPAELEAELRRGAELLASYRASLRVDPRGFVRGGVIDVPSGATGPVAQILAQLGQAYGQALVPTPAEPVGEGARWVETRDVDQAGMKLRQTTTYELRSRTAETIEVHAEIVQSLRAADFDGTLVPGVRARLVKLSGKGTADTRLDLEAAAPRTSEHRTDVRMILDVDAAGESSRQEIDLALELSVSRPPSP